MCSSSLSRSSKFSLVPLSAFLYSFNFRFWVLFWVHWIWLIRWLCAGRRLVCSFQLLFLRVCLEVVGLRWFRSWRYRRSCLLRLELFGWIWIFKLEFISEWEGFYFFADNLVDALVIFGLQGFDLLFVGFGDEFSFFGEGRDDCVFIDEIRIVLVLIFSFGSWFFLMMFSFFVGFCMCAGVLSGCWAGDCSLFCSGYPSI